MEAELASETSCLTKKSDDGQSPPPTCKKDYVSHIPSSEPCRVEEIGWISHCDIHEDSNHMGHDAVLIGIWGY
jgi:hypothetical protein